MRVIEAAGAGLIAALVVAGMAWWVDVDPVIPAGVAFLAAGAGWAATGTTHNIYGRWRWRRRHDFDLDD